jgi:cytoskeleton protein RodZ
MTAIGETLRRERLRRNLDLETISHELKISPKLLEAIEAEKFERLPGGVFAKSFVRQYARFLGLDEEEMAGEVQRILQPAGEVSSLTETPQSTAPPIQLPRVEAWEAVGESRFKWSSPLPALALVVVVMMACAGVYSWWQRTRHSVLAHDNAPAPVSAVRQPVPVQASPVPPAQPPAERAQATPAAPTEQAPQPVAAQPIAGQPDAAQPVAPPVPAQKVSTLPPQQPSNPNAAVRVELMADEPVWVLARTDGKYLFSGTLEPNQSRTVEANTTVVLRLGNAGGVNITLNGKSLGTLGPKGQVRTVQLTSGGFEIVAAPKPPALLDPL